MNNFNILNLLYNMSKKCISLGNVNLKIFLIFVPIIFRFCLSFAESQSEFYIEINSHPILYTLNYSLGLCVSFSLLIIYKIRNRTKNKEFNKLISEHNNLESSTRIKKATTTEKYLWILLVSFIDFIIRIISSIFWLNTSNYLNNWAFDIVFMSLFSYFILDNKLYKYHYTSIVVIVIVGCLYNILL